MPRRARAVVPGVPWHVIQRGNNRSACFFTEADYHFYLATLAEQAEDCLCAVHAYVLMENHIHLLITPKHNNSAALLMKNLGQRYVQYVNRAYGRSGTLWEGRYRSCLAQSETYALSCYRYIELNPVRAGIVRRPHEYPWSSYRANAQGRFNPIMTPHPLYLQLGRNDRERQAAYRALVSSHLEPEKIDEIRNATNGNYVLGDNCFRDEMTRLLKRRVVPGKCGRPAGR